MSLAGNGDTIYCDPPYLHGQSILYSAQSFQMSQLWHAVASATGRGAYVAVSADGWRRSGSKPIDLGIPKGLFARELLIERGGCMLRRFQMSGSDMELERVADRLLSPGESWPGRTGCAAVRLLLATEEGPVQQPQHEHVHNCGENKSVRNPTT